MDEVPIMVGQRDMPATAPVTSEQNLAGRARCPRCGYDLRGAIGTWADQCPLHGTCTECGLQFKWAEVLSPTFALPTWCIEAPKGWRALPGQTRRTFVRTFWPWSFWSSLHMSHPSRWPRLAGYCGVLVIVMYVTFAMSNGMLAWDHWSDQARDPRFTPMTSGGAVFAQAALLPLSDTSVGWFRLPPPFGPFPYATPLDYVTGFWTDYWTIWKIGFFVLTAHTVCGLAFVTLPMTRRVAKVRASHVVRVTLYGYGLLLPTAVLTTLMLVMNNIAFPGRAVANTLAAVAWLMLPALEVTWWSVATSRYLKMRHPWGIGVAVVIVGLLTQMAVLSLLGKLV